MSGICSNGAGFASWGRGCGWAAAFASSRWWPAPEQGVGRAGTRVSESGRWLGALESAAAGATAWWIRSRAPQGALRRQRGRSRQEAVGRRPGLGLGGSRPTSRRGGSPENCPRWAVQAVAGGKSGEAGLVTARGLLADHALGNRWSHGTAASVGGFRLRLLPASRGTQSGPHPLRRRCCAGGSYRW